VPGVEPAAKVAELSRAFRRVHALCIGQFSLSEEIGEDELVPLLIGYFYIANPPYINSNLIFLHEFCCGKPYAVVFEGLVVPPVSVMDTICRNLPGFKKKKYFRRKS
jgi:hypothetical protein